VERIWSSGMWQGFVPPQYIYANRSFKAVVLEPPDYNPGSWTGAGKALFDPQTKQFLLTARPRMAKNMARGFAANIYRSEDGESFELAAGIGKEEMSRISGLTINSIEGTQLLKDPLTSKWHFYISVDTDSEFVWGGLYWQTLLLTASRLDGPWESSGLVLKNDQSYDAGQARDATIDIVDGRWYCLYKAIDGDRQRRPALAVSTDGTAWSKQGVLTVDGEDKRVFLSGTLFATASGVMFAGLELESRQTGIEVSGGEVVYADKHRVGHGGGPGPSFAAYLIDLRNRNLETIFRTPWEGQSEYEHPQHPLLGYGSLVYDPLKNRVLTYVEAIDGKMSRKMGLNETVERLLLYETKLT